MGKRRSRKQLRKFVDGLDAVVGRGKTCAAQSRIICSICEAVRGASDALTQRMKLSEIAALTSARSRAMQTRNHRCCRTRRRSFWYVTSSRPRYTARVIKQRPGIMQRRRANREGNSILRQRSVPAYTPALAFSTSILQQNRNTSDSRARRERTDRERVWIAACR